jgi:hypothetical protein
MMASNFLAGSGPPELILLIIDTCDSTRDAFALTSTCRAMHHIGRAHAVTRLFSTLVCEIPWFEEALIAACTAIPVYKAS